MLDIIKIFPDNITNTILRFNLDGLEEIRIRVNKPIILKFTDHETVINYLPDQNEILKIFQIICDNSIYSFQNQICNGYITIKRRT